MEEGDECDGIYIVQKGTVGGYILNRKGNKSQIAEANATAVIGEVSFFLKARRTASIFCISNVRLFFLGVNYKKTLLQLCPMLYKRMRDLIYLYHDEVLQHKIKLLQESVFYLRHAERDALVELAFQMEVQQYQKDNLVINQLQKITQLIIVYDGMLYAQLPGEDIGFHFEKLPSGSSYGLYSILLENECPSKFKLVTMSYSFVICIGRDLMQDLTEKFPKLERQIQSTKKWLERIGVPICDFQINNEAMLVYKKRLQYQKRMMQREKIKELQSIKKQMNAKRKRTTTMMLQDEFVLKDQQSNSQD